MLVTIPASILVSCDAEEDLARCVKEHGEVAEVEKEPNYSADYLERWTTSDGCDIRLDVVMTRESTCLKGVTEILMGWPPLTVSYKDNTHIFVRDSRSSARDPAPADVFETLDEIPADATDTGLRHEGEQLWVDGTDDSAIYVVRGELIERWPGDIELPGCA